MARDMSSPTRGTNQPLFGRGYTTAEGAFRVPTIARWPGKVPAGTVCRELATTMDFLPTFALLAGGEPPRDRILDGHDIRPLLFGADDAKSPYDVFYYYYLDQLQAVRSGPWKLFLPLESFTRHPHFRRGQSAAPLLFHLEQDIGSTTNVADQHPEVVQQLSALAEKARDDLGDQGRSGKNRRPIATVQDPQPRVLP
jgi:arylsulfatase A-like enzyme